jgi:Fic family protein
MTWNWQQPDWPNFTWNATRLRKAEEHFLMATGVFAGAVKHLSAPDREQLTVEAISAEAVTTSEIEGEILDRASVQSSIRRQFGLATGKRRVPAKEQGISETMVDLYRSFAEPLSDDMLFSWHRLLFKGCGGLKDVGRYRTGHKAMEVVSGALHAPRVHFEAPPSSRVGKEMARFVTWFNRTAPAGSEPLPALTRAGIAHLYFELRKPSRNASAVRRSSLWRRRYCRGARRTMLRLKLRTKETK